MTRYIGTITTPEAVARQLALADPSAPLTPAHSEWQSFLSYAKELCVQVSTTMALQTGRVFVPYRATRRYFAQDAYYESRFVRRWFFSDEDLLLADSVSFGGVALTSDQWRALSPNSLPYYAVRVESALVNSYDFNNSLDITGWWGYSNITPYQSPQALDSVTINSAATTLPVSDVSLFETYEYLRIEDEIVQVIDRDEANNVLTLERGAQGTLAAGHTAVPAFRVVVYPSAKFVATRLVAWLYQKRNDTGDRVQFADGTSVVPASIPANILADIQLLKRHSWGFV